MTHPIIAHSLEESGKKDRGAPITLAQLVNILSELTFGQVRLGSDDGSREAVVIFRVASFASLEVVGCKAHNSLTSARSKAHPGARTVYCG